MGAAVALPDGDGGRQSAQLGGVRSAQLAQVQPGPCGQGSEEATLCLSHNGVEHQRALARSRRPDHRDPVSPWQLEIELSKIVFAGTTEVERGHADAFPDGEEDKPCIAAHRDRTPMPSGWSTFHETNGLVWHQRADAPRFRCP